MSQGSRIFYFIITQGYACAFSPSPYTQVCPYVSQAPWSLFPFVLSGDLGLCPATSRAPELGVLPGGWIFHFVMLYIGMSNSPLWLMFCICFSREYKTIMNFHLPKAARCPRVWWCVRTDCLLRRGMVVLVSLGPHGQSCQRCFMTHGIDCGLGHV